MIKLDKKIIAYLGREPDFNTEVKLQDDTVDGISNPYISEWNIKDKVKPTDDQLNALTNEVTKLENNSNAIGNRQKEYGSVSSQIEYITEQGLEAWKTKVQSIKLKYPKENS